jgi:hypothetical protein
MIIASRNEGDRETFTKTVMSATVPYVAGVA